MKTIILDRDGVINVDSALYIKSPAEWQAIPGSLEAIARLSQAGWRVIVATNQSGIGRGLFDMDTLTAMHEKMHKALAAVGGRIDAIFYCPHTADQACDCRKPKPGMFERIAEVYNIDLDGVPAIGDSLRDLQAGSAAGCTPILVRTGKGAKTEADGKKAQTKLPKGTVVYDDLAAAITALLKAESKADSKAERAEKADKTERAEKADKTDKADKA